MSADFNFGQARVVITPPIGTFLIGYPERVHGSMGIHDDLYAKAWVLSDGVEIVALAFLDLIGIDREILSRVRERVAADTPLQPHQIHLNYTHTHSGPACLPNPIDDMRLPVEGVEWPEGDPELDDIMVRHIAGVITAAYRSLRKGRIGLGSGRLTGMCSNRRSSTGVMDPEVKVIRLEEEDGRLAGAIINYGCHPTVLHQDNYLISRDYPGYTCDAIEQAKGGGIQVAFAQGAGADVSTRRTRRGTNFAEAERLGNMLGGEALKVLESIETTAKVKLNLASQMVELPTKDVPQLEEAERLLVEATIELERLREANVPEEELRTAYLTQWGFKRAIRMAREDRASSVTSEVSLVSINDIRIAVLPGELFASVGLKIKAALGEKAVVLGYCNNSIGYIMLPEDEVQGGYEAGISGLSSVSAEVLHDAVVSLAGMG